MFANSEHSIMSTECSDPIGKSLIALQGKAPIKNQPLRKTDKYHLLNHAVLASHPHLISKLGSFLVKKRIKNLVFLKKNGKIPLFKTESMLVYVCRTGTTIPSVYPRI